VVELCVRAASLTPLSRNADKSSGYGMPSNHAQSLAFFAAYTALFCVRRAHFEWRITRWALIGAAVALAAAVCWSRVALHLHSAEQVVVGALVGAAAGAAWHGLLQRAVRPHYEVRLARRRRCRRRSC
jgi:membrane-associated phospholipid phosphatase